jgi:hypothetical protein
VGAAEAPDTISTKGVARPDVTSVARQPHGGPRPSAERRRLDGSTDPGRTARTDPRQACKPASLRPWVNNWCGNATTAADPRRLQELGGFSPHRHPGPAGHSRPRGVPWNPRVPRRFPLGPTPGTLRSGPGGRRSRIPAPRAFCPSPGHTFPARAVPAWAQAHRAGGAKVRRDSGVRAVAAFPRCVARPQHFPGAPFRGAPPASRRIRSGGAGIRHPWHDGPWLAKTDADRPSSRTSHDPRYPAHA